MASVTYQQIKAEIAHFIGMPATDWDATTAEAVESCIRTGVDRVVHNGLHQWTWMRPRWSMRTASDQRRYVLPSDFVQFDGDLYFDGVNYTNNPLGQLPASRLLQLQSQNAATGTPTCFAIEPVAHDGVTEQSQMLVLHPTPDAAYDLLGVYCIGVRPLSDAHPYPPGGDAHGELFLAACLAATESKFLDGPAAKASAFQDAMQSHIAIDLRRQARNLGPLGGYVGRMRGRADARRVFNLQSGPTTMHGSTDF